MNNDEYKIKLVEEAKTRFQASQTYFKQYKSDANDDLRFLDGEQWDTQAKNERLSTGRPCTTVNRLKVVVSNLVNSIAKNRPAIQIDPKNSGADQDTAEVIAGLIRDIEYSSNADTAYDNATFYAVAAGLGFLRVNTVYEDEDTSDEQRLVIESINNPQCVYFDPQSTKADGSDAEYCFIAEYLTHGAYESAFPDSKLTFDAAAQNSWTGLLDHEWIKQDTVQVVEYFYKEYTKEKRYLVINNITGEKLTTEIKPVDPQLFTILKTRDFMKTTIKWCRFNGCEILEENEFPGKYIPIVPVYGDTVYYDGKQHISGIVRPAKDPQISLNYFRSLQQEVVAMTPKSPWVAEAGQVANHIDDWRNANVGNSAVLRYTAVVAGGQLLQPPQRTSFTTDIQAIAGTVESASEDLKAITGLYDPAMGADSTEVSGKAILARQGQSELSNSHYYSNLIRSVRHVGNILVELIPHYYNEERTIRIVHPNDEQELIAINQYLKNGKIHDLTAGRYEVVVQTGPSYATKRKESVDAMMALVTAQPQTMPIIGDLVVGNMDWPGSKDIAARLKTQVPAEVLAATEDHLDPDQQAAMIVQMKNSLQQLTDMHQQLLEQFKKTEMELDQSKQEVKMMKIKDQMDERDSERKFIIDKETIDLEYSQLEAEFVLKQQEFELKKKQLAVQGIKVASDIETKMFDAAHTHLDKKHTTVTAVDTNLVNDSDLSALIPNKPKDAPEAGIDIDIGA